MLFVKGYILCQPGDPFDVDPEPDRLGVTAGHGGRTVTQIAFEQLLESEELHVDVMGRQKRMWWSTSKQAVLDMMSEVKCAVRAALERLDADFSSIELRVEGAVLGSSGGSGTRMQRPSAA